MDTRVRECAFVRVCGLSQTSQQEWKRQPHDNVTSPPFIPATQHSETKQQPGTWKKAAWFTADMTSITNTNPPLAAPSRSSAFCSHLHLMPPNKAVFLRAPALFHISRWPPLQSYTTALSSDAIIITEVCIISDLLIMRSFLLNWIRALIKNAHSIWNSNWVYATETTAFFYMVCY